MTATPDLFSYTPAPPQNWRDSDPKTSKAAGISAQRFTADHHQIILSVLRRAGQPLAAEQISDAIGFGFQRGTYSLVIDTIQVCKRLAELLEGGAIERTAEQHKNRSGRCAFRVRIKRQPDEAAIPTG